MSSSSPPPPHDVDEDAGCDELPAPDKSIMGHWRGEQLELAGRVLRVDDSDAAAAEVADAELVGGIDLSFVPGDASAACAVLVVVRVSDATVVYEDVRMVTLTEPYIPGYLAFREAPHALALIERLRATRPDLQPSVYLYDGNGILHGRRAGIASHVGVIANVRTIGVAKTLYQLVDQGITHKTMKAAYDSAEMASKPGSHIPIVTTEGETVGEMVRGEHSKVPVYVSVGHRVSLDTAVRLVLRLTRNTHIPEPVRQADLRGRRYIKQFVQKKEEKGAKEQHD